MKSEERFVGAGVGFAKGSGFDAFAWREEYSLAKVACSLNCHAFGMATAGTRPEKQNWKLHVGGKRGGQRR